MRRLMTLGAIALGVAWARQMAHRSEGGMGRSGSRGQRQSGQGSGRVRNAGRQEMRNPPKAWDDVDERADASFPASDPPGTY
jgi:hypothetical protein